MLFVKRFQAQSAWFIDPNNRCLFSGIFFHMGLIWLDIAMLSMAIILLPRGVFSKKQVVYFTTGAVLQLFYYAKPYYTAVGFSNSLSIGGLLSLTIAFGLLWAIWSFIYLRLFQQHSLGVVAIPWLIGSSAAWGSVGLGFYDISPIIINSPWESLVILLGNWAVWVTLFCLHFLRHPILCYYILMLALACPNMLTQPNDMSWLDFHIYAESDGFDVYEGNAIVSRRIQQGDKFLHISRGIGEVYGESVKQHMIPFVEHYDHAFSNRVLSYKNHSLLVLICNDALYADWYEQMTKNEVLLVLSHLALLYDTPLINYFDKKLRYITLNFQKPVLHIDQKFNKAYRVSTLST